MIEARSPARIVSAENHSQLPPVKPATTRVARFDDYEQIVALQTRNGLGTRSYQDWSAMWRGNPACPQWPDIFPIGWVLEDSGGNIRGYLGNIPLAYIFNSKAICAATPYSWVVDEGYRVRSIELQHRFLNQDGVDLFVCTTPNAIAERILRALRFSKANRGAWDWTGFWITGYRGFAQSTLRALAAPWPLLLAEPLAGALCVSDVLTHRRPGKCNPGKCNEEFEFCETFAPRFEQFWEEFRVQNRGRLLAVRNRETLRWHFRRAMAEKHLRIMTASREGRLVAYLIFDRQDNPELRLRRIRLVDFQALDGFAGLLRPALNSVFEMCRRDKIHVVENAGRWLDRLGARDTPPSHQRRLKSWQFYYKTRRPELFDQLQDPDVWMPSSFDGDASL